MDTAQAYNKMAEANETVENLSLGQYGTYALLFLAEIAACFAFFYMI